MTGIVRGQVGPMWRSHAVLAQARVLLDDARCQPAACDRFRIAHLAALRASAALLAGYSPAGQKMARRPTSAWVLLTKVVPPMSAWAAYFAAGAVRRAAADAGVASAVSVGDADDLVASVGIFIEVCAGALACASHGSPSCEQLDWLPSPPVRHVVLTARAS